MLSAFLYRIYGWIGRIPVLGPIVQRWLRAHRGLVYRVRDRAQQLDTWWRTRRSDDRWHQAQQQIADLAQMVNGLRAALSRLSTEQNQVATERQHFEQQLFEHSHALNLKIDQTLAALLQRVERAENLLGQQRWLAQQAASAPQPRILRPERLAELSARPQGLWLEVGCGDRPDPERINIDRLPLPQVDIQADAAHLPLPDGSVSNLRAAHLVEHFTQHQWTYSVLPEWQRVLAPDGWLQLITPDLQAMLAAHHSGAMSEADLVHVLYGGQDYEGNFHYHAYSPQALQSLLQALGWRNITIVAAGRRNGLCFEFELHAQRPLV